MNDLQKYCTNKNNGQKFIFVDIYRKERNLLVHYVFDLQWFENIGVKLRMNSSFTNSGHNQSTYSTLELGTDLLRLV